MECFVRPRKLFEDESFSSLLPLDVFCTDNTRGSMEAFEHPDIVDNSCFTQSFISNL